jgi:hypothetical protein
MKLLLNNPLYYFLGGFALLAIISFIVILVLRNSYLPHRQIQKGKNGFYKISVTNNLTVDTTFEVSFIASTGNQPVNAVNLSVDFDPQKINISKIDTSKSFCQFYPVSKFSNSKGTINIECGAPNPGFTGENTIAIVTFYAKNAGETLLKINNKSQILLNDGKGTNIFATPSEKTLLILNNV